MRYIVLIGFFISLNFAFSQSQTVVGKYLEEGNTAKLTELFNQSIDLQLPNTKGIYNKSQATIVLNKFFEENPPKKYFTKHQGGGNEKAFFEIGNLMTASKEYRTYLLYDLVDKTPQIIELRIENED